MWLFDIRMTLATLQRPCSALWVAAGVLAFHCRALAVFSEESLVSLATSFELLDRVSCDRRILS